ncbi:MAG: DUF1257 domain-containing protein [Oscillatoriales cyanobacterium SM2_1_8]|nr:DUF1257 domain-containing protein [Oscillatoriales cyanobacterium SM2_1_8]
MSHFSQIKTQLRQLTPLQKALTDLGMDWKSGEVAVRGYQGQTVDAAIAIPQTNGYDIGFRWNGEAYELVADLQYWAQPLTVEGFLRKVTQRYAYQAVVTEAENRGFALTETVPQADGSVRVVLQRWA